MNVRSRQNVRKGLGGSALALAMLIGGSSVACADSPAQPASDVTSPTQTAGAIEQVNESTLILATPPGVKVAFGEAGSGPVITQNAKSEQLPVDVVDRNGIETTLVYLPHDKGVEIRAVERVTTREYRECQVPPADNPVSADLPVVGNDVSGVIQQLVEKSLVASFPTCFH
ncbi:hypothetical protein GP475_00440 [Corynebacterium poyangense]|uniref:Uncharacterized protein n=1 Tax=Corynebacterium poyangense TaxID=2684405 RepID=A0A7H0SL42_9CORY|nr:hypothetical protein [Corynebacterium poyangense]MBZ8177352.1 hypothetical protein [Corynebacterium poyangense]QNQ89267.1 hypothetical protein GP475_00440 [Corynebacterium poyangense]